MELNEQPFAPTLAHKLGEVSHVSGLLRRIAQLSGAGERVADWLLKVAARAAAVQLATATAREVEEMILGVRPATVVSSAQASA